MPVFICEACDEAIVLLGEQREVACDCGALMHRLDEEQPAAALTAVFRAMAAAGGGKDKTAAERQRRHRAKLKREAGRG